jgi:hypothetical protein
LPIRVACPSCSCSREYPDFLSGLTVVCKDCAQRIDVPGIQRDAITATAPRPAVDAIQEAPDFMPSAASSMSGELTEIPSIAKGPDDNLALPAWAIEYVVASLKVGVLVPDIEKRLVARGLPRAVADAVVSHVLEGWVGAKSDPIGDSDRRELLHRALSVMVVGVCLLLAYGAGGGISAGRMVIFMAPILACIWYPQVMGKSADSWRAAALRGFAWLTLLLFVAFHSVVLIGV